MPPEYGTCPGVSFGGSSADPVTVANGSGRTAPFQQYRQAATTGTEVGQARLALAVLLNHQARVDEAEEEYRAAISCGEPAGHKLYGMMLRRMGRNAEAAEQFHTALEHGNDDEVRLYLADVLHKGSRISKPRSPHGRGVRL